MQSDDDKQGMIFSFFLCRYNYVINTSTWGCYANTWLVRLRKMSKPTHDVQIYEQAVLKSPTVQSRRQGGNARQDHWRFYATVPIHPRAPCARKRGGVVTLSFFV